MVILISTVVMAVVTLMVAVLGALAWFHRRGGDERGLSNSITQNTAATTELAAQVGGLRVTLEDHGNRLVEHHWRLKALEDSGVKVTVERAGS